MRLDTRGFTLTELLVVVAIVAILAALAYPSYAEFVKRSNRAAAKAALLENAEFMERNFTVANRYDQDSAGTAIDVTKLPVQQAPRDAVVAKYTISVEATATTFTLRAEPVPGGPMAGDGCGTLKLDQAGRKGIEGGTLDASNCWYR